MCPSIFDIQFVLVMTRLHGTFDTDEQLMRDTWRLQPQLLIVRQVLVTGSCFLFLLPLTDSSRQTRLFIETPPHLPVTCLSGQVTRSAVTQVT